MSLYRVTITETRTRTMHIDADYDFDANTKASEYYLNWPDGLDKSMVTNVDYTAEELE